MAMLNACVSDRWRMCVLRCALNTYFRLCLVKCHYVNCELNFVSTRNNWTIAHDERQRRRRRRRQRMFCAEKKKMSLFQGEKRILSHRVVCDASQCGPLLHVAFSSAVLPENNKSSEEDVWRHTLCTYSTSYGYYHSYGLHYIVPSITFSRLDSIKIRVDWKRQSLFHTAFPSTCSRSSLECIRQCLSIRDKQKRFVAQSRIEIW